ncbi:MAG TPA: 16S rRNA (guanine(527)-N(7))-methyltransferase RsmG [Allosphingosinicella sp.]|jgi:16S rRNA (guanine527-N7)-methyltransferase
MDEDEARQRLIGEFGVPRETLARLKLFVNYLAAENERQNLVSRASLDEVWSRHILDSAQLLSFAPRSVGSWLDLGTGAGFPGLIVAALRRDIAVTMVEARRLRVAFLEAAADILRLRPDTIIRCAKVEQVESAPFDVISARAFAPLDRLLALGERFATANTRWILPKGKNAKTELDAAESLWQGSYRIEPSLTDADAGIIVAENVRRKARARR